LSGLQLNNLRIQLSKSAGNFMVGLTNADLAGQIIIPQSGIKKGVQARFSRLNLSSQLLSGKKTPLNPRDLPAILFNGENVRFDDMNLGQATLNLVPSVDGLTVKQLDLISSAYVLHATGDWTNARSRLQGTVSTSNVTELLKSWGFSSSNLIGSTANLDFDLNWPGGFFRPSVSGLSGTVSLKTGEGRIINLSDSTNAKIGLGHLLNIFSLQSLPRTLRFQNDTFQKGYSFDSLKGDFTLRNGNAFTQNTHFKGPIASIDLAGRIGLAAKDLDMKMGVTAHVTGSLPVVAAIATANPIVGVAAWAVDKMVTPAVSHITKYDYSITGSWANPIWNQMNARPGSTTVPASGSGSVPVSGSSVVVPARSDGSVINR
jgi:uncharacterized protein YhdP